MNGNGNSNGHARVNAAHPGIGIGRAQFCLIWITVQDANPADY
jgi:hypothetical protein